jgi:hypothetical protein
VAAAYCATFVRSKQDWVEEFWMVFKPIQLLIQLRVCEKIVNEFTIITRPRL